MVTPKKKRRLTRAEKLRHPLLRQELALQEDLAAVDRGELELRKVLGLRVRDAATFVQLAAGYIEKKDFDTALAASEVAIACDAASFDAWYAQGCALARLKRERDAISAFLTALSLRPDSLPTLIDLGELYLTLLDYQQATTVLRRALELDPNAQTADGVRAQVLVARTLMTLG